MAPHSKARARTVLSLLMMGTLAACHDKAPQPPAPATDSSNAGIDLAGIDRSVTPGVDFFRYANGTWLKTTEIPADRSSYGNGAALNELTTQRVAELIRNAGQGHQVTADARKVADYYASFMDETAIEAKGLTPLKASFERIAAIKDRRALSRVLGSQLRTDVDALNATDIDTDQIFGLWIAQDLEDPSRYIPFLLQGGLDLPDRGYYLDDTPRMEEIRSKLLTHITNVLRLADVKDAETRAKGVFDLERRIAEAHATRADSDDIQKANNHWSRKRFDTDAPVSIGTSTFRRRASPTTQISSCGSPAPLKASAHSSATNPSRLGRTTCYSMRSSIPPRCLRLPSSKSTSPFTARCWPVFHSSASAGSVRLRPPMRRSARQSASSM